MLSLVLSLLAIIVLLYEVSEENNFRLPSGWSGRILAMQKVSAWLYTVW